jgi:hypothetical protein
MHELPTAARKRRTGNNSHTWSYQTKLTLKDRSLKKKNKKEKNRKMAFKISLKRVLGF